MKQFFVISGFCAASMLTAVKADAQTKYGKPTNPVTKPADTTKPAGAVGQPANNTNGRGVVQNPAVTPTTVPNPNAANASGPATFRYDTTDANAFGGKPEISLRNNYAVDRSQIRDRKPLEYDNVRDDDVVWSEFIWREIDAREKSNQSFMYPGKDDDGDRRFFSVLLNAIKNDSVTAFSPENDRFTTPLTSDKLARMTEGVPDTVTVPDPLSGTEEKVISKKPRFSPDSVYTFRIKEQVLFDKEASRLVFRIIGIAPVAKQVIGGKSTPVTLFWLYYPDLRKTFAKADVYNPKNFSSRMTWEELFESRFFTSRIIKSSANNPLDQSLSTIIKDPLFRLLEGENIKTRIFNYEQDLWQY